MEESVTEEFGELEELEEAAELEGENQPLERISDINGALSGQKKSRRLPPLLRLTRRSVVFLSLTLLATIIFFITGNRQTFLDSNLSLILIIIACNSIALVFFSFLAVLECVFFTVKDKKLRLVAHLAVYAVIFVLSAAFSVASLTINLLSEGFDFW